MIEANTKKEETAKAYRFDIFKGVVDAEGKVHKRRSIGVARLVPGSKTYHIELRTLTNDQFYLLLENKIEEGNWQLDALTVLLDSNTKKAKIERIENIVL